MLAIDEKPRLRLLLNHFALIEDDWEAWRVAVKVPKKIARVHLASLLRLMTFPERRQKFPVLARREFAFNWLKTRSFRSDRRARTGNRENFAVLSLKTANLEGRRVRSGLAAPPISSKA